MTFKCPEGCTEVGENVWFRCLKLQSWTLVPNWIHVHISVVGPSWILIVCYLQISQNTVYLGPTQQSWAFFFKKSKSKAWSWKDMATIFLTTDSTSLGALIRTFTERARGNLRIHCLSIFYTSMPLFGHKLFPWCSGIPEPKINTIYVFWP